MPDPARCAPHGAYFCERCRPNTADDHHDLLAALVTLRELTTRVTILERRLNPSGCDHRLGNGLRCVLPAHDGSGHVYTSSQTGDRHVGN